MNIFTDLLNLIFSGVVFIIESVFKFLEQSLGLESNQPKESPHNAKFVPAGKVLKKNHTGFCLDGKKQLSSENSHRHTIIYGPSGTGKSKVVIQPSIYHLDGSMIVFDPAGDLFRASAGYLSRKKGYIVKRINYADPRVSDGFNPLVYAMRKGQSGINQFSELLIKIALGDAKDALYWNKNATNLLRLLIQVVQTKDKQYHTLASIYYWASLLESDPNRFMDLIEQSHNPFLISQIKAFLARDAKFKDYVSTTLQAALEIYADPGVALVSSYDSLDLHRIRKIKTAIFIQVPPGRHTFYRTPNSVLWETIFSELLENLYQPKKDIPVYCLLDEVGWLNLPNLPTYMAVARKHFAMLLALQDASQLVSGYGKEGAQTIEANAWAKLFFTNASPEAAEALSRLMGTTEIFVKRQGWIVRRLMSHVDLRTMSPEKGVLICGGLGPMKVNMKPYYLQPNLRKYADYAYINRTITPNKPHPYTQPSQQLQALVNKMENERSS
jgi:type IV secretion system protein VirD4